MPARRITQQLGPEHTVDIEGAATQVRRATWTVYQDAQHETWTARGYATGAPWDTFTLVMEAATDATGT